MSDFGAGKDAALPLPMGMERGILESEQSGHYPLGVVQMLGTILIIILILILLGALPRWGYSASF